MLRNQGHAARPAGDATVDARAVGFLPFQRRVVTPLVAVGSLGGGQVIVESSFELVAESSLAGEPQELGG